MDVSEILEAEPLADQPLSVGEEGGAWGNLFGEW